jgi:glycosyltransferase involved in cell wall biosynthesis
MTLTAPKPQTASSEMMLKAADLDVSVVLPCFNERDSVGLCVAEARKALEAAGLSGEVIVVDNNSSDGSADVASASGARVIQERRAGYGAALAAGIEVARGKVVVMADADCTYPLESLHELVRPIMEESLDLVLGSRLLDANRNTMPRLHRLVGTPILTYLLREGAGELPISDSQSGFRAFRRSTVIDMGLQSPGMEFASEMLVRAGQHDLRVGEVPLGYRSRVGESKLDTWKDGVRHLRLIFSLNPHLLLWQSGIGITFLGLLLSIGSAIRPRGFHLGSILWQPVYFSSILLALGLISALGGALLAFHSPTSPKRLRQSFAWVADHRFHKLVKRLALALGVGGVALDVALLFAWLQAGVRDGAQRVVLAGFAQSMILGSAILLAFAVGYPKVRESCLGPRSHLHDEHCPQTE